MPHKVIASAPGSLMLLGEHAVLHGEPALVCAVDKRINVTLTPRNDNKVEIYSALHGAHSATLETLTVVKPFHFVLRAIEQTKDQLTSGIDLRIESAFSDKIGFGSSAAVTVATLSALYASIDKKITSNELIHNAREVVRKVQGMGSGADVAASVYGGMVAFTANPLTAEKIHVTYPITALYTGFKTPTAEVIQQVQSRFAAYPDLFFRLCNSIGQCAVEGIQFAREQQWAELGKIMNIQQGLLESLGVSLPLMRQMIDDLSRHPSILGVKISGSGLGDCVVGLGELSASYQSPKKYPDVAHIPVTMTLQGVQCEKV